VVGPEATRIFYDPDRFDRRGVIPAPVRDTLFGACGVHFHDGAAHGRRKDLFLRVLDRDGTAALAGAVERSWDAHFPRFPGQEVVVFEDAAEVLARGVHAWAGVPLAEEAVAATTADLLAMVDGFASVGPRHLRARQARNRQEARVRQVVRFARAGAHPPAAGSPLAAVLDHRDADGSRLDEHTAAVELLNLLRPTVAVAWFAMFAAHALHVYPGHAAPLAGGDPDAALRFAHEVRRFYPFAPFLAARARQVQEVDGVHVAQDSLLVLDLFGQDHDPRLWPSPWTFDPARHAGRPARATAGPPGQLVDLVPQGGGDPAAGHRCPGEPATVTLLARIMPRLASLPRALRPGQDLRVTRHRTPARVVSGMRLVVR
jgi:fatty-acid peroxygenase